MSRPPLPGDDTLPWYRQFWPWFLILLPGSVVVASLVTLYIASHGADDLVVDEYYREGLAINRRLEKLERAEQMRIAAVFSLDNRRVRVGLSGPHRPRELDLALVHPLEADRDLAVTLRRDASGAYSAALNAPVSVHWRWILQPPTPADWRLEGEIGEADIERARER